MRIFAWIFFLMMFLPGHSQAQDCSADVQSWIDAGDTHWENRAKDAQGSRADPKEIDEAIVAYKKALTGAPDSLAVQGFDRSARKAGARNGNARCAAKAA